MRKTVIVVAIAAFCLLCACRTASAAPDASTRLESATASTTPVQLSDEDMSRVVGGQINVGGGGPPEPPLSGYIQNLVDLYGVPPGQMGGYNGLANYIRSQFPSTSPGLGQIFH